MCIVTSLMYIMYIVAHWLVVIVASSFADTIFELSEVDNYDEDQTDTRSDCIPEEEKLKPVPKPRVGGRLSSNSDGTVV